MAKSKEELLAELTAANAMGKTPAAPVPPEMSPSATPETQKGGNVRLPAAAMTLARALAKRTKRSVPMALFELLEADARKNEQ